MNLESLKSILPVIQSVAPAIATAFGGPLAGTAVNILSQTLFGKSDATEKEIVEAVASGNPEMLLKLKEADQNFVIKMKELDIDLEKVSAADRDSARNRQVEMAKTGKKDYTQDILAYVAIIGFFAVLYALFVRTLPEGLPRDAFLVLLGTLTKIVGDLYNYYFGSSSGSNKKTEMMADMIKGA